MTHAIIDTRNLHYNRQQSTDGFARMSANLSTVTNTLGHAVGMRGWQHLPGNGWKD